MNAQEILAYSQQFVVTEPGQADITGEGYYAASGIVVVVWHKDILHQGAFCGASGFETLDKFMEFLVKFPLYGSTIEWLSPKLPPTERRVEVTPALVAKRYKPSRRIVKAPQ